VKVCIYYSRQKHKIIHFNQNVRNLIKYYVSLNKQNIKMAKQARNNIKNYALASMF